MSLTRPFAVLAISALALCATPRLTSAQTQVKPYFLVIFDTSGSMNDTAPANSCAYQTTTTSGMTTTTAPRKMDAAKCALGKLLSATGDADFGLMQFDQSGSCGNGANCGPVAASAQLRIPIETNTSGGILSLIDKTGTAPANELCAGGRTPLGGTLVAAKDYFEVGIGSADAPTEGDAALSCRPLSVILLTDGVECCNTCDVSSAVYNTGCPTANATLVAAGKGSCPSGASACGSWGGCNDGDAFESAPEKAFLLQSSVVPSASGDVMKPIKTYVIGFGLTPGDARLERIAAGGGTDNPSDGAGGNLAFYAQNEAALSVAFSQIIADSQPPTEICNDEDDDCDTLIDEGFPKYCDLSMGITEKVLCDEPMEAECDGVDDDCDGILDEGTMNECGACGDEAPAEVCDDFDNDCDGKVDEDTSGGECGRDEGECKKGELVCIDGMLQCEGAVGPEPEQCNGLDDDCDGTVDEDPNSDLCPEGRCVAGQCSPFCDTTEFVDQCSNERRPETQPNGECLCVVDSCDDDACAEMTITRDDANLCAPDDDTVTECLCRGGACTHACDNVVCRDDQVCDPRRGICALNDCRGLGCEEGFLCDAVEKECIEDPCADADCDDDQVCRRGRCEPSCGDIQCGLGESCKGGRCIEDSCANVICSDEDDYCVPGTQTCEEDPCAHEACDPGFVCISTSGECERDPCFGVQCPSGQGCRLGECLRLNDDGTPVQQGNPTRILATGGGGCSCSTVGGAPRSDARFGFGGLVALAFAGLGLSRLRRRRGDQKKAGASALHTVLIAALALGGAASSGCSVSPFCVNCVDPQGTGGSAGTVGGFGGPSGNGGSSGNAGNSGAAGVAGFDPDGGFLPDGGDSDACQGFPEVCNGEDDDCDQRVDEDVEPDVNNCEQRGICGGSEPSCVGGEFKCQYPAEREDDETLCDELDNDCDGTVDENFETLGDDCFLGVGQCATQGELECNGAGTGVVCVIGEPNEPGDEVCDGLDNDCDGVADEPASDPGTSESFVRDEVVQIAAGLWMYKYEASRPDSSDDEQGIIGERACSKEDVLPWTNVTYDEAVEACEAADMVLCTEAQWVNGCNADPNTCLWGYTPTAGACTAYPTSGASPCNGHNLDAVAGEPDTDALAATGAFERCFATQMASGQIFDLSGNAKEWVTDDDAIGDNLPAGSNPTRGGSYNNLSGGMRCDFSFSAANNDVRLRNLGFRCCTTTAPP